MKKVFKSLFFGLLSVGMVLTGCKLEEESNNLALIAAATSGSGHSGVVAPEVTIEATGLTDGKCEKGSVIHFTATSSEEDVTFTWLDNDNNDISSSFNYSPLTKKSKGSVTVPSVIGTYEYTAVAVRNDNATVRGYASVSVEVTSGDFSNAVLQSIKISDVSLKVGEYKTVTVTGVYLEGNSEKTSEVDATITSSDPKVVTVSGKKLTAIAEGSATITASYDGKTSTATVKVLPANITVTGISVAPTTATIEAGKTTSLVTTATYSNGTTSTVTPTYTTNAEDVATVSADGTITAVAAGSAVITATYEGYTAQCTVTVTASTNKLVSISAKVGSDNSMVVGSTATLVVTATYQNGTTATVTPSEVTFSNTKVSRTGNTIVAGDTAGTCVATIKYVEAGVEQTTTVTITVEAKQLKSITLTANPTSISYNGTTTLLVKATYEDNSIEDVTANATIASGNTSVLTISKSGSVATGTANNESSSSVDVVVTATFASTASPLTSSVTVTVAGKTNEPGSGTIGFDFN